MPAYTGMTKTRDHSPYIVFKKIIHIALSIALLAVALPILQQCEMKANGSVCPSCERTPYHDLSLTRTPCCECGPAVVSSVDTGINVEQNNSIAPVALSLFFSITQTNTLHTSSAFVREAESPHLNHPPIFILNASLLI